MRWPLFIQPTPFRIVGTATLYEDTWLNHVLPKHIEVAGKLPQIQATLAQPFAVVSASEVGYYTFVSNSEVAPTGHPLIVVVSTVDTGGVQVESPVVATAFYGSPKYLDPNQTKWEKHWP